METKSKVVIEEAPKDDPRFFHFGGWLLKTEGYDIHVQIAIKEVPGRNWFGGEIQAFHIPESNAIELKSVIDRLEKAGRIVEGKDLVLPIAERDSLLSIAPRAKLVQDLAADVACEFGEFANYDFKLTPYDHQKAGLAWLKFAGGGLLGDEMGLGKTKQIIDLGKLLLDRKEIPRVVIVCPTTLKRTWVREILINAGHRSMAGVVTVVRGGRSERNEIELRALREKSPIKWLIYNYEQVWRTNHFKEVCDGAMVVADEAHKLKNPDAKQTSAFTLGTTGKPIIKPGEPIDPDWKPAKASHLFLLTGTPVVNNAEDLFNLMDLVRPGLLGRSKYAFLKRYARMGNNGFGNVVLGYRDLDDITEKIARAALRRTRMECLDLPPKVYSDQEIEMEEDQEQAYIDIVKDLQTSLMSTEGEELFVRVTSAMVQLIRLQQCLDGFLSDGSTIKFFKNGGAKFQALDEIAEEVIGSGKKLVVWSRFVPPIYEMMRRYAKYNPVGIWGAVSQDQRDVNVRRFQEDPDCKMFIGQVHTAGLGLTLTAASDQVFISRWWSPSVNLQAEDRLHRIGQENKVIVTSLLGVAGGKALKMFGGGFKSVDQVVAATLKEKIHLANVLTGDAGVLELKEIMEIASLGLGGIS